MCVCRCVRWYMSLWKGRERTRHGKQSPAQILHTNFPLRNHCSLTLLSKQPRSSSPSQKTSTDCNALEPAHQKHVPHPSLPLTNTDRDGLAQQRVRHLPGHCLPSPHLSAVCLFVLPCIRVPIHMCLHVHPCVHVSVPPAMGTWDSLQTAGQGRTGKAHSLRSHQHPRTSWNSEKLKSGKGITLTSLIFHF